MRRMLLVLVIALFLNCPSLLAGVEPGSPNLGELKFMAQLPAELPQRVSGFAYDGEKFWVVIYQGQGRYATLNPSTLEWKLSASNEQHKAIKEVSGAFQSTGGISFVSGKLWIAGSYGGSYGSVDLQSWKVEHLFKRKLRDDPASQTYWGMAFDGNSLWIAWHWFNYKLPESQTQLLLKIDPETGQVISEYPLPAGTANDGTHGLTWDGTKLWHIKDNKLSSIDSSTGAVAAQYTLAQITRASGLAWDGQALWIIEFDGKVWRLPFQDESVATAN